MAYIINRVLSAAVAIVYLIAAYVSGGPPLLAKCAMYLLLPMACIWFGEEMGAFTGVMRGQSIDAESPGCLVAFLGWVLLLLPVFIPLITRFLL
jgi:hypothetical protein